MSSGTTSSTSTSPQTTDASLGIELIHLACTTEFGDWALPADKACCGWKELVNAAPGDAVNCPMCALLMEFDLPCVHTQK